MSDRALRVMMVISLLLGLGLVLPFRSPWLLTPGVLSLIGFVVCGVFAIANPSFLASDYDTPNDLG